MNNTGIEPVGKQILLDVTPKDHTTAAGIVLPQSVQGANTRMEGVIVAIGKGCERDYEEGKTVYVSKYMSAEILRGDKKYKLANEDDVLATLETVSPAMPDTVPNCDPIDPGM